MGGNDDDGKKAAATAAALSESIADAVAIKDSNVFMLTEVGGGIPCEGPHGLGVYFRDCRYLNACALQLQGTAPEALGSTSHDGFAATHVLTNRAMTGRDGSPIENKAIEIRWEQVADAAHRAVHHILRFTNHSQADASFSARLELRSAFEDVFVVRGALPAAPPEVHTSWTDGDVLELTGVGIDEVERIVQVRFQPRPSSHREATASLDIDLAPEKSASLRFSVTLQEGSGARRPPPVPDADLHSHRATLHSAASRSRASFTRIASANLLLNAVLDRALADLHMLETRLDEDTFFAAGLPWFATLFGRDTLVTSLEMLAFSPDIAEQTLRLLARHQGTAVDEWRAEQPGKILHELRVGPMARAGRTPHSPYYGSVDSTLLFLILLERHAAWTGRLDLFHDVRDNARRALEWMEHYGDSDHDGYIDYRGATDGTGLSNQGWKDSGDSIVNEDGTLARPPIALVEVQGYAYRALLGMADLHERDGDGATAERLRARAHDLRSRFNRDFWMERDGYYALALQAGGRPCAVAASNPGQALWTGIADAEKAAAVAQCLMQPDLWSGWGVRTLSADERRYNPVGYHLGTVWPHDNALIAAGLRRYGHTDAAMRIFDGLLEAAEHFPQKRLPELFTGIDRQDVPTPVRYPVACHPQAWAAAALPCLVETMLGLTPFGFENRIEIHDPRLPPFVDWLELSRLRVGSGAVDLLFHRVDGVCEVEVLRRENAEVAIQPAPRLERGARVL